MEPTPVLKIFDSLKGDKRPFQPLQSGTAKLYVCGITAYDYCHLGHARVMVVFDTVVRYLRAQGLQVTYVRNITDIDDKIIKRARELDEDYRALSERFVVAMHEDGDALGLLRPDQEPRATVYMPQIIAMIERLLAQGYAYVGGNGDVYYDVSRFPTYGKLSGRRLDELQAGARVEVEEAKDDPLDFVLWKLAKPAEPSWGSPWGAGRPGWHIECSAMATCCLGNHFDIHGGGMDLKFPHHENEIAQSEAATGETFVNYWMHVGFVQVGEEKMAKSLGNFVTIRDVLARHAGEVLRYYILGSHYRSPLAYGEAQMEAAAQSLRRLYGALADLPPAEPQAGEHAQNFAQAMADDLNTPRALAVLFDMAREINRLRNQDVAQAARLAAGMRELAQPLGLLQRSPAEFLRGDAAHPDIDAEQIEQLIQARQEARQRRDFAAADRIRDELADRGIVLEDTAASTKWRFLG
jgi:cysteinyl-tRNA synthetase